MSQHRYIFKINYEWQHIVDAANIKEALLQMAEYNGHRSPIFEKALGAMDTIGEQVALFNNFAYNGIQGIYELAEHFYGDTD